MTSLLMRPRPLDGQGRFDISNDLGSDASGGLGPSRGREAPCAPGNRV